KTLSNPIRLASESQPVYGTPSFSSSVCTVPSSPYVPCNARKTACVPAGNSQPGPRGSSSNTSCPRERNAADTPAPERNDTSRSALGPPNITVIFHLPAIPSVLSNNLHFRLQLDRSRGTRPLLDQLNQFQDIPRGRLAVVDNKIPVLLRHHRAADACSFEAQFLNQFAGGNKRWILEHATSARRRWLRRPPLLAERIHARFNLRARDRMTFKCCAQCNVVFQKRAAAILDFE